MKPQSTSVTAVESPLPRMVIIGHGMVAAKLCEYLVKAQFHETHQITIIGDEPYLAYNRIQLSSYVTNRDIKDLELLPQEWYQEHQIQLVTGVLVESIDRSAKTLTLANASTLSYDKLILATGSRPNVPPIQGADLPKVYVYRNIKDLEAIISAAKKGSKSAVIGGGLLGLEAAQALQALEVESCVVEYSGLLMSRQLNQAASKMLEQKVDDLGIKVHLGIANTEISQAGEQLELNLNNKIKETVDFVVISAGIIPNSEIAQAAGLEVGARGGVIVNGHLETNDPDIYAIGECALLDGFIYGLAAPGYTMAEHLVKRFQGNKLKPLSNLDLSTRLKMLGVDVFTIGDALGEGRSIEYKQGDSYRLIHFDNKYRVLGALAIGEWEENGYVHSLFKSQVKVHKKQLAQFKETGELGDPSQNQSIVNWPENRIVCNCLNITKGQITACLKECSYNYDQVALSTGASTSCGSCEPLVKELCGTAATPVKLSGAVNALLVSSIVALLIAIAAFITPDSLMADSVESIWYKIEKLWRDAVIKQITGYSMLAIFTIGLLISARKRLSWFSWGKFASWRFFHAAFGVVSLIALYAHTGFSFGQNLNFWLMAIFVVLNLLGAVAGITAALENRGTSPVAIVARRFRPILVWSHILLFWPLPILIVFHIIAAYKY